MKGLSLSEVARLIGSSSEVEIQVSGYQVDSRFVEPGELFFALKGERTNGHRFLADAKSRGAVGAVVLKGTLEEGMPLIEVDDVLTALQHFARESLSLRPGNQPRIVGITGSVGKTTTKEFLASLLEGKYRTLKSKGSTNTQLTFPLNILNRSGMEDMLVLEMGMSASGQIERLVSIAPPDLAIITKVALAHAMNFPLGLSAIAAAKAEIFSHPKTKTAVLDFDFLSYGEVVNQIRAEKIITFSITNSLADYYLSLGTGGRFRIDERGVRSYDFDLPFKEGHFLHNFTAAVAAARQLGIEWEEIEARIPFLQLPKMRFEQFEREGISFINDAYNANPASMRAALENLPLPQEGGKRIAVLATMKELGEFSGEAHEEIGRLAQKHVDFLLCLGGDEMNPLCAAFEEARKPIERFLDHGSLAVRLQEIMRPGDVVLFKGSRAMELEKVMELLDAHSLR